MTKTFAVKTEFSAVDRMSAVFAQMEKSGARFGKESSKAIKQANSSLKGFKSVFTGIMASRVVTGALGALRSQVSSIIDEFITFENALVSTASRMNIVKNSGDYKNLEKGIRAIGGTTEFTNTQVAKSAEALGQAGYKDVAIAMQAIQSSADLATVGQVDLTTATEISANALAAFGMKTKEEIENVKNLERVNNALSRASDASIISISDLYESMEYAAGSFRTAGSDIETFAAMAAVMGNAGVDASKAGRAMTQSFLRVANPVGAAKRMLRKYNVEIDDGSGNMKDQLLILADLSKALMKKGNIERQAAIQTIYGTNAYKGMVPVIELGEKKILEVRDKVIMSGKTAAQKAKEMRQSIQNQLEVLESTKIEMGFRFIDKIRDKLPIIIDKVTKAINSINVDKIEDGFIKTYEAIKSVYNIVSDVYEFFKPLIKAFAMVWTTTKIVAFGEAAIAVITAIKVGAIGLMGPFYAMVYGISAAYFAIRDNWEALGRDIPEAFRMAKDAVVDLLISAVKWMTNLVKDSWLGTLLVNLGLVSQKALDMSDKVIDKMFGREYTARVRPEIVGPPIQEQLNTDYIPQMYNADVKSIFTEPSPTAIKAPSLSEPAMVEAQQAAKGSWEGTLNIKNAPSGSSMSRLKSKNAPPLNVNLGQN